MASNNTSPNANILKFLPSHYSVADRTALSAIIKATNGSIDDLEILIRACIDQLNLSSAQGRYLVNLGESQGFVMPQNSGLDIRAYRTLVPVMVADPKQVRITVEEIVRAFYLSERVRPNLISAISDPFQLIDGDNLIIETQSGRVNIAITASQVNDIDNVSAAEIAAIFNTNQSDVTADAPIDRGTSSYFLRLTSKAGGASAYIKVVGGTLQNILKFETLLDLENETGTTFNLTKTSIYSDELTFTWDGVGTNPKLYNISKEDVITIRGLVDGVEAFSLLNGSYTVVDSGYDYFIVRNEVFDVLSSTLVQPDDDAIIGTSSRKTTIFDKDEYAIVSEVDNNTVSVTVPAIPPLAKRFLVGSTHLRGDILQVLDFTRNSLQVQLGLGVQKPDGDNWIQLASRCARFDFRQQLLRSLSVDSSEDQPTYTLDASGEEFAVLPFTVPTAITVTDPIYGEIGSSQYALEFNFPHGLKYPWGFTVAGATGAANILVGDLNKEHVVFAVNNKTEIRLKLYDSLGIPVEFEGFPWGPADLYQFATTQSDGADFYLEFVNSAAAVASGLVAGMSFTLDPATGIDVDPYIAGQIRYRKMSVMGVSSNIVRISTGYGVGSFGFIIDDVSGNRSGSFGGSLTYFFDKTSAHNLDRVEDGLVALMLGRSEPQNPDFVGSYFYDPQGLVSQVTVTRFLVNTSTKIFKGDNIVAIEVDSTTNSAGEELPQTGYIVLDYGSNEYEGPIRYLAVVESATGPHQILIDPAYVFRNTHEIGSQVQVISQNVPFAPGTDGKDYPIYVTGTATARDAMFQMIQLILASGIFLEEDVIKPELRYSDEAIEVFD